MKGQEIKNSQWTNLCCVCVKRLREQKIAVSYFMLCMCKEAKRTDDNCELLYVMLCMCEEAKRTDVNYFVVYV